ncbi:MAG: hypothetical protein SFU84_03265 [Gemmatimonadales bacterium]|nr:hypothetical protein [Gemmatimonadales bacterium]
MPDIPKHKPINRQKSGSQSVTFKFERSEAYRNIHVDGAWGGVTAHRLIHMELFSEFQPPPREAKYTLHEDGRLDEHSRIEAGSVTRELEVGAFMNVHVARALVAWLEEKIKQLDELSE